MEATGLFAQLGLTVVLGFMCRKLIDSFGSVSRAASLRALFNRTVLWVTMPALVFQTVQAAPLGLDILQAPAAAIAGMAGTALVAWALLARRYGSTPETGGLVLAASAGSVSFFGIPIVRALFGAEEARVAVYFAVLNVPLALAVGAIISARIDKQRSAAARIGRGGRTRAALAYVRIAGRQLIGTPATWALVAGVALQGVDMGGVVDGGLPS